MTTPGNREAGDRNLSTADLAAARRRPQTVDRDDELDGPDASRPGEERSGSPGAAKDTAMSDRAAATSDRAAADRTREPTSSAPERKGTPMSGRAAADKPGGQNGAEQLDPLFSPEIAGSYRTRWAAVQSSFVDDPKRAVREGDELVAQMMKNLAESFATERSRLETQLGDTGATTTETLRVSLRRYRSFFERLLSL